MDRSDIYYRAFKEYRKETADNNVCERDRRALCQSNPEGDVLQATKYLCTIQEDWVKTIEEGLEFVEKAVREERQFIRTNGEVLPIEKVKKISKDSVEHLARHSDMITHVPEEEDATLIPDKLYMVEKLSDYAVYENRFLYMMLCYLRDFINFRLEKIDKLRRTYLGDMQIRKEVVTDKRKLLVETKVREERTDNPYPIADERSAALLQRIQNCQQIVMALLNTDLMVQVAKTPMIKPPIVKTNVLKMNNNFKRALALYDYVATYKGDGYTYEEVNYNFAPFTERVADEIAEAANLSAFLAFEYGNDIADVLEREYQSEEERRRAEEAEKLLERIKRLKKRALESNKTLEEYMLLLEQRNRMLEKDSERLAVIKHEVELLNQKIEELHREKAELNRRIEELEATIEEKNSEILRLNQKYIEDMAAIKRAHAEEIYTLNAAHEEQIELLNAAHEEALTQAKLEFAQQLEETISAHEAQVVQLNRQIEELRIRYEESVREGAARERQLNERIEELSLRQTQLTSECEEKVRAAEDDCLSKIALSKEEADKAVAEMREQTVFMQGQLDGIRAQQGHLTPSADHSSKERFLELEAEFEAFQKFFREQWKLTKKEIRKAVLWKKEEKGKREK